MHKHVLIIVEFRIPLIITKEIGSPFLGFVSVGVIMKIEPFFRQGYAVNCLFTIWIQVGQNTSVFPKNVIDSSHIGIRTFIEAIIERITAIIRTKLLVFSPI